MSDDFGNRMKTYEMVETNRRFLPLLPVYARIDGRGFSKFTKGMKRPYDTRMSNLMIEVTKYLVQQTHAIMGYTQSDEISLLWHSNHYDSGIIFDGKTQKMTSILSSMATSKIMHLLIKHEDAEFRKYVDRMPSFDCRVFNLPNKIEATNTFLWREQDACKNAISMAAHHYYSHKELQNKNSNEMQELLFAKGINFNDYPSFFKRGTFIRRETTLRNLMDYELEKIPVKYHPTGAVIRSSLVCLDMPKFSTVTNREQVIFDGAEPVVNT